MDPKKNKENKSPVPAATITPAASPAVQQPEGEKGGQAGPEPTRFGDWEKGGRCTDF